MSEVIDRVAWAIVKKMAEPSPREETSEQIAMQIARAAIKAMLEPTSAQLAAGQMAWVKDDLKRSSTLYRAMIEAAPNEK